MDTHSTAAVCSAVDLALAAFPASMFWNLNMEWKKKVSLSCLMGLGVLYVLPRPLLSSKETTS